MFLYISKICGTVHSGGYWTFCRPLFVYFQDSVKLKWFRVLEDNDPVLACSLIYLRSLGFGNVGYLLMNFQKFFFGTASIVIWVV